jgi:hypothetical protein
MGYQERDWEVIDYQAYQLESVKAQARGIEAQFRGPKTALKSKKYFVCLGAAQTFGCYSENPYPSLLSQHLKMPVLNLGVAGASPTFFLKNQILLNLINNAKFAVVQVMSGRSESNSLFTVRDGFGAGAVIRKKDNKLLTTIDAYTELFSDRRAMRKVVQETEKRSVENHIRLLQQINIPTILLWFSERKPRYKKNFKNLDSLFGKFPHLIDEKLLSEIKLHSDYYVEAISNEGMPQELHSRFTGKRVVIDSRLDEKIFPWQPTKNYYYPSPEMQIKAFKQLRSVSEELANG